MLLAGWWFFVADGFRLCAFWLLSVACDPTVEPLPLARRAYILLAVNPYKTLDIYDVRLLPVIFFFGSGLAGTWTPPLLRLDIPGLTPPHPPFVSLRLVARAERDDGVIPWKEHRRHAPARLRRCRPRLP